MSSERNFRLGPRLLIGLAVMIAGSLYLLENLGVLAASTYLKYWPVILILIGILKIVQRGGPWSIGAGLIWIATGAMFLAGQIDLFEIRLRHIVPVILIFLGGYFIWSSIARKPLGGKLTDTSGSLGNFAFMGGVERRIVSQNFRGGEAAAVRGGVELDLRGAAIEGDSAVIDVFALWGGIELTVPEDWVVVSKVLPVMGAYEQKTKPQTPAPGAKELIIRGFVIMGGVEVKN
jgi:predicted membrane protein